MFMKGRADMAEGIFIALIGVVGMIVAAILTGIIERGTGPLKSRWVLIFCTIGGLLVGLFIGSIIVVNIRLSPPEVSPTAVSSVASIAPTKQAIADSAEVLPTDTPVPTVTRDPTDTPVPTGTRPPTDTAEVLPTDTPIPTITKALTATPTLIDQTEEVQVDDFINIPFDTSDNAAALNPIFGWQPGESPASSFNLTSNPGKLTIVAGPKTEQWGRNNSAPIVSMPIEGDFEVSVKVEIMPETEIQAAGLGVMSAEDQTTWLRLERTFYKSIHRATFNATKRGDNIAGAGTAYPDDSVYFWIKRNGSVFSASYSTNNTNWVVVVDEKVFEMPEKVNIYLYTYSTKDLGVVAKFSDFRVRRK